MAQTKHLTVSEVIATRHSCRDFLSKPVSVDLIMSILNKSRRAPSSMLCHCLYKFVLISICKIYFDMI